jgi:hypothetical protein
MTGTGKLSFVELCFNHKASKGKRPHPLLSHGPQWSATLMNPLLLQCHTGQK